MRKAQKKQAESFLKILGEAHAALQKLIKTGKCDAACEITETCQQGAILLGGMIEQTEGENFAVIPVLEEYCEWTYQLYERLKSGAAAQKDQALENMDRCLTRIKDSVRKDIKVRLEIVFFPYKSSMWDSLESVWMAADQDTGCDAYVVPIPYFDKKPDGTFGAYHYEAAGFPDYVPIQHYESYILEERQPDIVYIHNPYDEANYVTSVDPGFYSKELKKHTKCLVYIPYYATSGGMGEGQADCPAYHYADYIVIQAEKYRKFFARLIPENKLLPLGSPKFDRAARMCASPPEPPKAWKQKLEGKKVYFYNTSINGMLENTKVFLDKMEYVFRCFQEREGACLLWRPHPLLEATFHSMRRGFQPAFDKLKQYFIEHEIGIYDDTPDVDETIALCDAYIGDAGSSVASLFGAAGKPVFMLINNIASAPGPDDWRGDILKYLIKKMYFRCSSDNWIITQGNKLYHLSDGDYEYCCDLSDYASGAYYAMAVEAGRKVYACPMNAQDILVLVDGNIQKRIPLKRCLVQKGAFMGAWRIGNYLFLIPIRYPAVVRYDIAHDKVDYITGYQDIIVKFLNGEWVTGGSCVWREWLLIASPADNRVLGIDSRTGAVQVSTTGAEHAGGCMIMTADPNRQGEDVWLLPYSGTVVTCWNPKSGKVREFDTLPENFRCRKLPQGYECRERPFSSAAFYQNYLILSPCWANMFIRLDKDTGKMEEWIPPFPLLEKRKNGYHSLSLKGFFWPAEGAGKQGVYRFYSAFDSRLYETDLEADTYREIIPAFSRDVLEEHEPGFCEYSEWFQYACQENALNTLGDFLDGTITGNAYEKSRQTAAYDKIAANSDGTSGEKIHQYLCGISR